MSIFSLRLEACAAPRPPTHYFQELADIANRLGVDVKCDMNGITVYVEPGCDVNRLKVVFADCVKTGGVFCHDGLKTSEELKP